MSGCDRMKSYVFIQQLTEALRNYPWRVDEKPVVILDDSGHTYRVKRVVANATGLSLYLEQDEDEFFGYEREGA